ncbi:MAG: aminotransferase class III-fold pyridoxal phosphate-dependent enzyme [Cyanobacteria bacterium P01_H01_bin.105]
MSTKVYSNPDRQRFRELIRFNQQIVRAEGHYLYDEAGTAYLDMIAQTGSVPFGHNPTFIWEAVQVAQSQQQPNFIQPFVTPASEKLAKALIAAAPGDLRYVTFTNSGAETIEVAIRLSRAATQRSMILRTSDNSGFHGETLGSRSAIEKPIYQQQFLWGTEYFEYVPFGDLEALRQRLEQQDIAAFIVEPIHSESGMIVPPKGYLPAVANLCKQTGTLFVLDENQTGLGRTGRLFAAEHEQLTPDILLLSKALSGGLTPIGACLYTARSWTSSFSSLDSSTFVNNQVGCLAGLAVLEQLQVDDQALIRQVALQSAYLRQRLDNLVMQYPHAFKSVTGQGYIHSLQLAEWDQEQSYFMSYMSATNLSLQLVQGYLLNEHHIVTFHKQSKGKTLFIEPPLTIELSELDRLLEALSSLGEILENRDYGKLLSYVIGDVPAEENSVSANYQPLQNGHHQAPGETCLGRFTFFAHPSEVEDLIKFLPLSLQKLPLEQESRLKEWLKSLCESCSMPAVVYHIPKIRSKVGGYVEGWLICNLLTPQQMMRLSRAERDSVADSFVNLSKALKADVIGLGGYSAVITNAGEALADCGLHVTSGNSLTAMVSSASLKATLSTLGKNLGKLKVGIVGASGSVGYLVCKALIFHCRELTLFGNPHNPGAIDTLKSIAGELYCELLQRRNGHSGKIIETLDRIVGAVSVPDALLSADSKKGWTQLYDWINHQAEVLGLSHGPIRITTDLSTYLPLMNAVISATSQGYSFIEPALLAPDAVVCDSARPADVVSSVSSSRSDVLVYEGGLVRFPEAIRFGVSNQANQPAGLGFACLVETIVLAMSQVDRNYSIGRRIPFSEAEEVFELALKHGFQANIPVKQEASLAAV